MASGWEEILANHKIYNLSVPNANTEVSQALNTTGSRVVTVKCRDPNVDNSVAVTISGGAAGVHTVWVCLGTAAVDTVYVCPQLDIT